MGTTAGTTHTLVTELVVAATFFGVTQYLIRLSSFFELVFGFLIAGVFIRMVLQRHLTIGFLDIAFARTAFNTQYFVIVSLSHDQIL